MNIFRSSSFDSYFRHPVIHTNPSLPSENIYSFSEIPYALERNGGNTHTVHQTSTPSVLCVVFIHRDKELKRFNKVYFSMEQNGSLIARVQGLYYQYSSFQGLLSALRAARVATIVSREHMEAFHDGSAEFMMGLRKVRAVRARASVSLQA